MQNLAQILSNLEHLLNNLGEAKRAEDLAELRKILSDSSFRVVIFGEFNYGKSTLINALLGRIVLPAKLIPTTGHITQIVYDTREEVRVKFLNQSTKTYKLDQLDSVSSINRDGVVREDIESIEVSVNNQLLKNQLVFIDTPGLNEHENQTQRARKAIAKADLVLLMLNAQVLLNIDERSLATDWLHRKLGKPVVPVVNFMNRLEEKDRNEVRIRIQSWCRDHLPTEFGQSWFEIDALGNLKHRLNNQTAPNDDFGTLLNTLANLSETKRQNLQHRARYGQLLADLREIEEKNNTVLKGLLADTAQVKQQRMLFGKGLANNHRHFKANSKLIKDRLKISAQKIFAEKLFHLTNKLFKDKSKQRLEEYAGIWYEQVLKEAAVELERTAQKLLLGLAGGKVTYPKPFALQERMILETRLNAGELPSIPPNNSTLAWWTMIGAILGTFVAPGIGTVAGGFVGAWVADLAGSTEANYEAAYANKATEAWQKDTEKLLCILLEQFNVLADETEQEIIAQLCLIKNLLDLPPSNEWQQRQILKTKLENGQRELKSALSKERNNERHN